MGFPVTEMAEETGCRVPRRSPTKPGRLIRTYTWGPASTGSAQVGIDNLLAMTVNTGATVTTYFPITDHLGTIHAMATFSGAIVESYKFDAWGRVLGVYNGAGVLLTSDLCPLTSSVGNRYLWQGREYSWNTGLYYFRARWYDPITGRFLSNDPIGISGGLNQYCFCNNNPVNFRDPSGLWSWKGVVNMVAGAASGFVSGLVSGAAVGSLAGPAGTGLGAALGALGGAISGAVAGYSPEGDMLSAVGRGSLAGFLTGAAGGAGIAHGIVGAIVVGGVAGAGQAGLSSDWDRGDMILGFTLNASTAGFGAGTTSRAATVLITAAGESANVVLIKGGNILTGKATCP